MKAIIFGFQYGAPSISPNVVFYNDDGSLVEDATSMIGVNLSGVDNQATYKSLVMSAIATYAAGQSYTVTDYIWAVSLVGNGPTALVNAPQASLADGTGGAVTNLPTNYNIVSGLLGIANGLNDANSAQNDLAAKFNALVVIVNGILARQRTLGLIST